MIEEAIVLVEMQNEDRGFIDLWIRGEPVQQMFDQVLATGGGLGWMRAMVAGRDDQDTVGKVLFATSAKPLIIVVRLE
jgi:hypothetical protein